MMTLEEARKAYTNVEIPDSATNIRHYTKKSTVHENGADYFLETPILEYIYNDRVIMVQTGAKRKMRR